MIGFVDVGNSFIKACTLDSQSNCMTWCDNGDFVRWALEVDFKEFFVSSVRAGFTEKEIRALGPPASAAVALLQGGGELAFPAELDIGSDRIFACEGARRLLSSDTFAVATCGTATTITIINDRKCTTSLIWPGVAASVLAIEHNTRIKNISVSTCDASSLPKTLAESVAIGILRSTGAALCTIADEFLGAESPLVVAGGAAHLIAPFVRRPKVEVRPDLVLKGIVGCWHTKSSNYRDE